ncbi:uncharacterized protein LOC142639888 [Castanea sativa]|uniref:uncharacterized protein LOC142639888 n=1 Tax=Castanea sativa TaxID=21020 RepID=UPI003F64C326
MHVNDFLQICATCKFQNFTDESVRLCLFPFSLKDKAKTWLNSLSPGSITSWELLVTKFLSKFFPMAKTNALRREIADFYHDEQEKFYESWERFKDLILKCPHHSFETWRLVQYFYNGLTQANRNMIESMNGGGFLSLVDDEAYKFLENFSESSQQWDFSNLKERSAPAIKKGGLYEVSEDLDIKARLNSLTCKVEALALGRGMNSVNQVQSETCSICASPMHTTQMCPSVVGYPDFYTEQANSLNNYGKPFASPFLETYNPNWMNHPNFSWRQNQPPTNVGGQQVHQQSQFRPPTQAYPPIPQSPPQFVAPPRQQSSLEESLKTFMQSTSQAIQEIKSSTHLNTQAISKLENQIGQLATQVGEREKGKFPSQPIPNPKGQYAINGSSSSTHGQEHVQSITTLRSGKQVDNQVKMPEVEDDENIVLKEKGTHSSYDDQGEKKDNPPSIPIQDLSSPLDKRFVSKAPFPQRLISPQKSAQFGDILEVFKQVQINIPFLDAIQQVPVYAKFLKDLVTMKRKTNIPKKEFLTE